METEVATGIVAEGWWVQALGSLLVTIIGVIGAYVTGLIRKMTKNMALNEANKEAVEALLEGMAKAQDDIGRDLKLAAADGKLSKEEALRLRNHALDHAKNTVSGPAKEIIMAWTTDRVASLIKQLLSKYTNPKPKG